MQVFEGQQGGLIKAWIDGVAVEEQVSTMAVVGVLRLVEHKLLTEVHEG